MFVIVTAPTVDITTIVSIDEALAEFREQDPTSEPEAWARRIAAAEQAWERETGVKLRRHTVKAEGRSVARSLVWLPIGPIVTINTFTLEGTAIDPASVAIVGMNTCRLLASASGCGCDLRGWLTLEAVVGYEPATIGADHPDIKQALLQLIGHWSEHREAAQSQTAALGGSVLEVPESWRQALDRWRLVVAA
jgi:hypothetical protein